MRSAKHYPLLTADEWFRLFVKAVGRKDEQELDTDHCQAVNGVP